MQRRDVFKRVDSLNSGVPSTESPSIQRQTSNTSRSTFSTTSTVTPFSEYLLSQSQQQQQSQLRRSVEFQKLNQDIYNREFRTPTSVSDLRSPIFSRTASIPHVRSQPAFIDNENVREPDSSEFPRNNFYKVDNTTTSLTRQSTTSQEEQQQEDNWEVETEQVIHTSQKKQLDDRLEQFLNTSITDKLIDQFFHEQMIELDIKPEQREQDDPLTAETHTMIDVLNKESVDKGAKAAVDEEKRRKLSKIDQERGKNNSVTMCMVQGKTLEAEIKYLESKMSYLSEEETGLKASLGRLNKEIELTKDSIDLERRRRIEIQDIHNTIDREVQKTNDQQKLLDNADNTSSTLAFNILKLNDSITSQSEKLKKLVEEVNYVEEELRRTKLYNIHILEKYAQKLEYSKKWFHDTRQIENKNSRDLELARKELSKLNKTQDFLQAKLKFCEKEEGSELIKNIERVVRMLKGKEELPNGSYISVARALDLYSQLKEAAHHNRFTVEFFRKFLREHKEFGIFVPEFDKSLDFLEEESDTDEEEQNEKSFASVENEEEDNELLGRVAITHKTPDLVAPETRIDYVGYDSEGGNSSGSDSSADYVLPGDTDDLLKAFERAKRNTNVRTIQQNISPKRPARNSKATGKSAATKAVKKKLQS